MNNIGLRADLLKWQEGSYPKVQNRFLGQTNGNVVSDYFSADTFTPQEVPEATKDAQTPPRTKMDTVMTASGLVLTLLLTVLMAFNLKPVIAPYLKKNANKLFKDYSTDPNIYYLHELPGMQKAKELFYQKIVQPTKHSELYQNENVRPSAFFLLWGDPGVGKTNFVYSAAKEVGAKVATIKLSEEGSSYVNGTAIQIHEKAKAIISHAKKNPKQEYFVLIDEIEAILEETHKMGDEKLKDIKTLLQTLDMFKQYKNIRLFATTNSRLNLANGRVGNMNAAAINRFSTKIFIERPDKEAISDAFKLWLKDKPSAQAFVENKETLSDITDKLIGYSYRDLQNIKDLALERMMNLKLEAKEANKPTDGILLTKELMLDAMREYAKTSYDNGRVLAEEIKSVK